MIQNKSEKEIDSLIDYKIKFSINIHNVKQIINNLIKKYGDKKRIFKAKSRRRVRYSN